MRRQAIVAALLIVGVGVVLGATVFRADIAQATGLAQSVTVANTTTNPVPVREQNLDGGNIKVHEQGTADVKVNGVVTTQTAAPVHSFSDKRTTTSGAPVPIVLDCPSSLPAGTRWFVSSFTVADGSSTLGGFFRFGLYNLGNDQIDQYGPVIYANPQETVELTFPQPYEFIADAANLCLAVWTATDVFSSVVGYYTPPA